MQIAIVSASPRTGSASLKVAKFIQTLVPEPHVAELFSFDGFSIPSVATDWLMVEQLPKQAAELYKLVAKSEKVVFVVPEYNRMVPAEYAAFIHQFQKKEFADFWQNKTFAFVGVSSGVGGREPIYISEKVFNYAINSNGFKGSFVSPFHFQSTFTGEQFDEKGEFIGHDKYKEGMQKFVENFVG